MKKILVPWLALLFALSPGAIHAQSEEGSKQYVSDEITLSVRERPSNDAPTLATVTSGEPVSVLQSLGAESFAQIRTKDGAVGWVIARYLSEQPAARAQLSEVSSSLADARKQIADLEAKLADAQGRLEAARPAMELESENRQLKSAVAEAKHAAEQTLQRCNDESAKRKTMVTGAALIGAGTLLGLVLPLLGRRKRRSGYSDF